MGLLGLGGTEILLLLLFFAVLFFGGKKIPEFSRALGRAMGEFTRGKLEIEKEIRESGLDQRGSAGHASVVNEPSNFPKKE